MTNTFKKPNKLTIPDLITIGVFTALYFVLVTVATFGSAAIFSGFSNIVLPVRTDFRLCLYTHGRQAAEIRRYFGEERQTAQPSVFPGDPFDRPMHVGKLTNPMWYATMCAADGGELKRCSIVRTLRRMPQ